jgi:hypothetical protein
VSFPDPIVILHERRMEWGVMIPPLSYRLEQDELLPLVSPPPPLAILTPRNCCWGSRNIHCGDLP